MPPRRRPAAAAPAAPPAARRRRRAPTPVEVTESEAEETQSEEETEEEDTQALGGSDFEVEEEEEEDEGGESEPSDVKPPPPRRARTTAMPHGGGGGDGGGGGGGGRGGGGRRGAAAAAAPPPLPPVQLSPRVSLLDLPNDVLASIAALIAPKDRFAVLPLVCKAFKAALTPPCAAWEDLVLKAAGVRALAAVAVAGGGGWPGRAPDAAALRAMASLRAAAPRLRSLDIYVKDDLLSARAAAAALRLLLGGGGDNLPPLAPHLSRVAVVMDGQDGFMVAEHVAALIDRGGLAALVGAPQVTSLHLALLGYCRGAEHWRPDDSWPRRFAAVAAAAPAAIPLRELVLEGFGETVDRGRHRAWQPQLVPFSQLAVERLLPRMAATLESLTFFNFGRVATLQGAWRGRLTRLTCLDMINCTGFTFDDAWQPRARVVNGRVVQPAVVDAFPALVELVLPVLDQRRDGDHYDWVATCRRLTAVTLFAGEYSSSMKENWLRRPPYGVSRLPSLRRLVCGVPPGLPFVGTHGAPRICYTWGLPSSLTYLKMSLTHTKRIEFPGRPRGYNSGQHLPRLAVLDLRDQQLEAPPRFRANACASLRILRLGFPDYGDREGLASATGEDPDEDDPVAVAAASRRPFNLTPLAKSTVRGALPRSVEELELENVCLFVNVLECPNEAALVATNFATKTAPGLRTLRLTNAATTSRLLYALLGEDGGAVLTAAYARRRSNRGAPPTVLVGDDLINEVPAVAAAAGGGGGGGGGGAPPAPAPEEEAPAVEAQQVAPPAPALPPECAFQ